MPNAPKPRSLASTGRPDTQHCAPLSTCCTFTCTCTARSARCKRSNDASLASPERPLRFPRSGHTQAMCRHRPEPLQLDDHRKYCSTNGLRLHTIDGSRTHRQHMNRWRVWRGFEGLRGGRLGCGTNGVQRAHLQRRCALPPMFDAWTAGTALHSVFRGTRISSTACWMHVGPEIGTARQLEAVPILGPTP